ncbi:MAG: sigma-70 family RNA polymerase sigma factor [Elusimicrobiota bacterium]|nr:sigma-70 family RNA polymerase sigma factor [Elusimicrobiota bacterium]
MEDPTADAELVRRCLDGDEAAFEAVLDSYRDRVYALLLRLVRDPRDAEDLAQEAFLKAFRALASYDPGRPLASWLFKIAHNAALDFLRARGEDPAALDDPESGLDPAEPVAGIEAVLVREETRDRLERIVAGLPPLYREILLLRHKEDLDYRAIGEVLGLPEGTVKNRLFRARDLLKARLESAGEAP